MFGTAERSAPAEARLDIPSGAAPPHLPPPTQQAPYPFAFPPQRPPPHQYPQHYGPPTSHFPNSHHPPQHPVMAPLPVSLDNPPIGPPLSMVPPHPMDGPPMMPQMPLDPQHLGLPLAMDGGIIAPPHFGHHPAPPPMEPLPPHMDPPPPHMDPPPPHMEPPPPNAPYPEPPPPLDSPTEDSSASEYSRDRREYRSDVTDPRLQHMEGDGRSDDRTEFKRSSKADKEERKEHRRRQRSRESPELEVRGRHHDSRRGRSLSDSEDGYRVAKYDDVHAGSPDREDIPRRREGEKHDHHRRKYDDYRRGDDDGRRKADKHGHRSSKYEKGKHDSRKYEERRYGSPDASMDYEDVGKHHRLSRYPQDAGEMYGHSSQDRPPHHQYSYHPPPPPPDDPVRPHSPLLPMETDVISSEEDDILGAKSSSGSPHPINKHGVVSGHFSFFFIQHFFSYNLIKSKVIFKKISIYV